MTIRAPFVARLATLVGVGALALAVITLNGQSVAPSFTLVTREGRRPIPTTVIQGQEVVAVDDLAAPFALTVREESGALTVSAKGHTALLTADRPMASVNGRLVALPTAPLRSGGRWHVPLEFLPRVLSLVLETPIELRRASRLAVVGGLRVPRISVRYETVTGAAQLTGTAQLTVDAAPRAATTITRDGSRLLLQFDADAIDPILPPAPPDSGGLGLVQGIRQLDGLTLAIDLGARFATYRATTTPVGPNSRTELTLMPAQADTVAPNAPIAPAATLPPANIASPQATPASTPASSEGRSGLMTATPFTVVLDPGHGGEDSGSHGGNGTLEKDVTLAAARRLRAALESRLGARVLMTREDDRSVALESRTSLANNNKADLFISLHANWSPRPSATGTSVSIAAFDDAEPPRPEPPAELVPLAGGRLRRIELVPWERAQRRHLDRSAEFAARFLARLRDVAPLSIRPLDRLPLPVLEAANMPAVLVEMGFLSNPDQEPQLTSGALPNLIVQALVDVVAGFKDAGGSADEGHP